MVMYLPPSCDIHKGAHVHVRVGKDLIESAVHSLGTPGLVRSWGVNKAGKLIMRRPFPPV